MEKKQWIEPSLTVYGNVAALTQGGTVVVIKRPGLHDDFVDIINPNTEGSAIPCILNCDF